MVTKKPGQLLQVSLVLSWSLGHHVCNLHFLITNYLFSKFTHDALLGTRSNYLDILLEYEKYNPQKTAW